MQESKIDYNRAIYEQLLELNMRERRRDERNKPMRLQELSKDDRRAAAALKAKHVSLSEIAEAMAESPECQQRLAEKRREHARKVAEFTNV